MQREEVKEVQELTFLDSTVQSNRKEVKKTVQTGWSE